jgi:gluconate 2-dehydrogenase gamma chain
MDDSTPKNSTEVINDEWIPRPDRRDFLRNTLVFTPLALITACTPMPTVSALAKTPDSVYSPLYFTVEEWNFLHAACARLIPDDEHDPGAIEAGVPEFIDRQMEGSFGHATNWYMHGPFATDAAEEFGYQGALTPREVYRAGIAALDRHCRQNFGKVFAELPAENQDALLTDLEKGKLDFDTVSGKTFFNFLLQNTKEGYLADPIHGGNKNMASWTMIGFPGARADFADWVERYGEHYPMPPVSVSGRRG